MDWVNSVVDWNFLNEPAWRWFVFIGVLLLFLYAWNGILEFMK